MPWFPSGLVANDLRSYARAADALDIECLHERGRWKNNGAENSRRPTQSRERNMQCIKSVCSAPKLLSAHAAIVVNTKPAIMSRGSLRKRHWMLRHLPEPHYARARLLEIVIRGNFGQHSGFQIRRDLLCEMALANSPARKQKSTIRRIP
jgi:hypothetical protein